MTFARRFFALISLLAFALLFVGGKGCLYDGTAFKDDPNATDFPRACPEGEDEFACCSAATYKGEAGVSLDGPHFRCAADEATAAKDEGVSELYAFAASHPGSALPQLEVQCTRRSEGPPYYPQTVGGGQCGDTTTTTTSTGPATTTGGAGGAGGAGPTCLMEGDLCDVDTDCCSLSCTLNACN
jgi:hypothetical protein